MNCGEKIARLRKQNNMTQSELGDELNVTYQAVSKWERSESLPDFDTISRIAKLFKVPISYFEEGGEEQVASDTYDSKAREASAKSAETSAQSAETSKQAAETSAQSAASSAQSATYAQSAASNAESAAYFAQTAAARAQAAAFNAQSATQPIKKMIGMCVRCGKILREGEADTSRPIMICNACSEKERQEAEDRILAIKKQEELEKKRKEDRDNEAKNKLRKRRNLALLIAIIPAVVLIIIFLVSALQEKETFGTTFGFGCVLAVFAYTFTAQMIWDGTVREVCTGGGKIIDLPGIIFSFSPEGFLFLIVVKIIEFFIVIFVFIASIFLCIFLAIVMSPFSFIPSLLWHNREIRKATAVDLENYGRGSSRGSN